MNDFLRQVWAWTLATSARNWAAHSLIAVLYALFIGSLLRLTAGSTVGAWMAGSVAAAASYAFKEGDEILVDLLLDAEIDWRDHAGDAFWPAVAVAALQAIL